MTAERPVVHDERVAALLRDRYTAADLDAIEALLARLGVLDFPARDDGLYPAVVHRSDASAYTGYHHVWVRDTVHVAHARLATGDVRSPPRTAATLLRWFARQRARFVACIDGTADRDDPMQRPHVRFDGDALAEIDVWWPHAQNDALGYALWLCCRLASMGLAVIGTGELATLRLFPRYFDAIRYWQDADSGHWEEHRKVNSSSIGAVVAGLRALSALLVSGRVDAGRSGAVAIEVTALEELAARGERVLAAQLPRESPPPRAGGIDRGADAALLFLVEPLGVVDDELADRILALVLGELEGPYGIRRYTGDSYWMADYKRLFDEATRTGGFEGDLGPRDAALRPGTEAQWCLFDPLVSVLCGRRLLRTRDESWRARQVRHFNRALGQITGPDCPLGAGLCPEAYYLEDSRRPDRWVCNDDAPLLWTQAHLVWALHTMRRTHAANGAGG